MVIDFGLVQLGEAKQPASHFLGTFAFASPEQIEGRAVGIRSDVYSLGATLWYALTGKPPREVKEPPEITKADLQVVPSSAPLEQRSVPFCLRELLAEAVAPLPNDRPASAAEFAGRLQACLEQLNDATTEEPARSVRPRGWKIAIQKQSSAPI